MCSSTQVFLTPPYRRPVTTLVPAGSPLASGFEVRVARPATMRGKATTPSQSQEGAVSSEDLHAPRERLTDQTIATHQAITSLVEELQAMDWYRQRADDCD